MFKCSLLLLNHWIFSDFFEWILVMYVLTMMLQNVIKFPKSWCCIKIPCSISLLALVWFSAPVRLRPAPRSGQLSRFNSRSPAEWPRPPCSEPALVSSLPGRQSQCRAQSCLSDRDRPQHRTSQLSVWGLVVLNFWEIMSNLKKRCSILQFSKQKDMFWFISIRKCLVTTDTFQYVYLFINLIHLFTSLTFKCVT